MKSRLRYLLLLPPAVAFVLVLSWAWPGAVSVDMRVSIFEGRDFRFWGHQEPMSGLLWAIVQTMLSVKAAVMAIFVAQIAIYWISVLLLSREALRAGSVVGALAAVAGGFLPPLLCFTVMVESNIHCGIAWMCAIAVAASSRSKASWILCGALLWLGFMVRSGMIVAIVPVVFTCVTLLWPQASKWRALGLSIVVGLVFQGVSFVVTKTLLGAPTRDSVLSVSQVFDLAAIYQRTGVHHVPGFLVPEGHTAEEVLALYKPDNVSGMFWRGDGKPTFRLPQNPEEGAAVRAAWLQTIREFPGAWLESKLRYSAIFLMIGVDWAGGFWPDYGANEELGLSKPEKPNQNPIGVYAQTTATSVWWKGWFWMLLTAAVTGTGLAMRISRSGPAFAAFLGGVCSMMPHFLFGQAALARYCFLPYSLFLASMLLVLPGLLARLRLSHARDARLAS